MKQRAEQLIAGKRIGLLTASASRLGGGVFEAVAAHAAMLRALGAEPEIFALDDAHASEDRERFGPTPVHLFPVKGPGQIGFAPDLLAGLMGARLDVLHLHGIWMYPSRAGERWARRTGRPYLISPHGMLDPWITGRGRAKKALARIGYERANWRAATRLHALTAREAADITRESGREDSLVIANAGPPADAGGPDPREPTILYLGRIHPKKNLLPLVSAWSRSRDSGVLPAEARLIIAGWGDPADLAALRAAAGPGVEFVGPAYGEAKARLLRAARFMILPSLSEGLPMAMLEAWAHATPAIMTEGCNLPEGFAAGAALPCGYDQDAIAEALGRAFALAPAEWTRASRAALQLAETRFSAAAIARQWEQAYAGLLKRELAA